MGSKPKMYFSHGSTRKYTEDGDTAGFAFRVFPCISVANVVLNSFQKSLCAPLCP